MAFNFMMDPIIGSADISQAALIGDRNHKCATLGADFKSEVQQLAHSVNCADNQKIPEDAS
jgi:hypothetical protein